MNHDVRDIISITIVFGAPTTCILALAIPPALREKSWKRFGLALFKSTALLIPIAAFILSSLATPNSKNECNHLWWRCFMSGKIMLAPFILWGAAALYAHDILKSENRERPWVTTGIVMGFLTTALLTAYLFTLGKRPFRDVFEIWPLAPLFLSPFYMTAWGGWRSYDLWKRGLLNPKDCLVSAALSIPLWFLGLKWSHEMYARLPENTGCFIVTAAMRGHENWVGPFTPCPRTPTGRANKQLLAFWAFECKWEQNNPGTHRLFRLIYNRIGPPIARRIRSPWAADAVYLLLKPLEWAVK